MGEKKREKTDGNSGHYVIASSQPPERRPLEHRTLAPKKIGKEMGGNAPWPIKIKIEKSYFWTSHTDARYLFEEIVPPRLNL